MARAKVVQGSKKQNTAPAKRHSARDRSSASVANRTRSAVSKRSNALLEHRSVEESEEEEEDDDVIVVEPTPEARQSPNRSLSKAPVELRGDPDLEIGRTAEAHRRKAQRRDPESKPDTETASIRTSIYSKLLEVVIGTEQEIFIVHTHHIALKSAFFKAAASEAWIEGRDRCVTVQEISPIVFGIYLDWVYTGRYSLRNAPLPQPEVRVGHDLVVGCEEGYRWESKTIRRHIECYAAAQYLLDDALKIAIVDSLREFVVENNRLMFSTKVIQKAWDKCQHGCGVQRLLIDWSAQNLDPVHIKEEFDNLPQFVADMAARLLSMAGKSKRSFDPKHVDRCFYHDHPGEETCAAIAR